MSFDATDLTALIPEIESLIGSRVNRIWQPDNFEIVLAFRTAGENRRLLLSAHPERARMHLTAGALDNPSHPPNFCMYLRRHLQGARLTGLTRPEGERIVQLHFRNSDALGDERELTLIVETMGKHSNIIAVHRDTQTILAVIRPITAAISRWRQVLPGLLYLEPPKQERAPLSTLTELDFYSQLTSKNRGLGQALLTTVAGLSPLWSRELLFRAALSQDLHVQALSREQLASIWKELISFRRALDTRDFRPSVYVDLSGRVLAASPLVLYQYTTAAVKSFGSMSEALDYYFDTKRQHALFTSLKNSLGSKTNTVTKRITKRLAIHDQDLNTAEDADVYLKCGQLLLAHAHELQTKGSTEVVLSDWEEPPGLWSIELDPSLPVSANAQAYFTRYNKAKKTVTRVQQQKAKDLEELAYLQGIKVSLEAAANIDDLTEIKTELEAQGYIRPTKQPRSNKNKQAADHSQPLRIDSDNFTILVGKNNRQNDWLTFKVATADDLWLHAKDIPGSHVIIRGSGGQEPPQDVLLQAAELAAYHSRARDLPKTAVDYTYCRYVKKPAGSRPGFVTYNHHQTIYVTPDQEKIKQLIGC